MQWFSTWWAKSTCTVRPFWEAAITEAQAGSPSLLVIDLTGVSFMASIGITLLLKASRDAGP